MIQVGGTPHARTCSDSEVKSSTSMKLAREEARSSGASSLLIQCPVPIHQFQSMPSFLTSQFSLQQVGGCAGLYFQCYFSEFSSPVVVLIFLLNSSGFRLFPGSLCSLVWCVHGARCALEQIQTCSGVRLCFLLYLLFLDSVNAPKRQKSVEISLHCESGSSRLF